MALGALIVLSSLMLPAMAASAFEPAALRNTKTVSATDAIPNETFNWVIEVGCSVLSDECVNASLTDTIPAEFIVGPASSILVTGAITPAERTITVTGQDVRIDFLQDLVLPVGEKGLKNGILTITIPVQVRDTLNFTPTPIVVSNTSILTADNAPTVPSTASVNITVPLRLATVPTKSFLPATNIVSAGVATTLTVATTNTSNSPINTFTVQDPVDPSTATIFSNVLAVQSPLGAVTWPAGATGAIVSVWDVTALPTPGWVSAPSVAVGNPLVFPAGVALINARGVRIEFSSGTDALIPRDATASFQLALQNRVGATTGTKPNTAQSTVAITGQQPVSATANANYTLTAAFTSVAATKDIFPDRIATVALPPPLDTNLTSSVVTLTARNNGTVPLQSLTISEPSSAAAPDATPLAFNSPSNPLSPSHSAGGGGLIFDGFTSAVDWPAGATAVAMRYFYSDGTDAAEDGTTVDQLPAPDLTPGKRVTGFVATFTGVMPASAVATLPFTVRANTLQVAPNLQLTYSNTVRVSGVNVFSTPAARAVATDTVTVYADQISVTTTKTNTRGILIALPGQTTVVTLQGRIVAYPETTRGSERFEMADPSTATGLTEWYRYFNPSGIVATQVPGGATVTVQYRDALGTYTDMPGFIELGPGTYTQSFPGDILDDVYGIKLIWKSTTGFNPGQQFTANIGFALRSTLRGTSPVVPLPDAALIGVLENCSSAQAASGVLNSNVAISPVCPKVDLRASDPAGGANLLDKNFINVANTSAQDIITTRNNSRTRVRLNWSTAGYTNVNSMVVYDGPVDAAGDPAPLLWNQRGTWDAFNLASVPAINTALDPLVQYDQVTWELFNKDSGTWETPSGWPCRVGAGIIPASPCLGSTALRTLTSAEQERYVAVRLTFTERPGRTGLDPAPGSGVAASSNNNRRIDLVFQLRNALRSDAATPVVNGYQYNVPIVSPASTIVLNGAHALATLSSSTLVDRANDTITLQDPNLAVAVTKTWAGGNLPIPDATVVGPRPSGRVTIVGTNQTSATVNALTIEEPNPGVIAPNDSPFEKFDLARFVSFTPPSGATALTVTAFRTAGGNLVTTGTTALAAASAIAWTPAQLAAATGFRLDYTGAIAATSGAATVVFDLVLRSTHRSNPGVDVTVADSPVYNSTQATVADPRYDTASPVTAPTFTTTTLSARAAALKNLLASSISVTTTKAFVPASQLEGVRTPVSMTLTATPGGTERVKSLVVTDDRASFWNAFDFLASRAITLPVFSPNPPGSETTLTIDVCINRTWTASAIASNPSATCTETGGTWTLGTPKLQSVLGGSTPVILPTGVIASQVQGLRYTVQRADGSQWENPQAPTLTLPLSVQRRLDLRTGGPVLTDYVDNLPAPGETAKGTTTNNVTADIEGIWGKLASATASRTYLYQHALTSVEVLKTPTGAKAPGQRFDYTLTVRNTGGWPIVNPVITDYLPTDALGALLIFDPDNPWTYTYGLTGAAPVPANGTLLPSGTTGPTVVVVNDGPGPKTITFTFPSGAGGPPVLEVGQTYTITIPMLFRPGLISSTAVTNTFGIKGDRKFNACTAPPGFAAQLALSGECVTGTTVRPAAQSALRALISVKAIVDEPDFPDQGYAGPANCASQVDADGFSRLPCIPRTLPGQKEVWRLTAQNTGTTQMPRLVLAMRLPTPGDLTILDSFVRQSAWTAKFADEIGRNIPNAGATFTPYYSTATNLCRAVLINPANPAGCSVDPAIGWAPWTAGALPDPTVATAVQFVIDFLPGAYFSPGELITVDITTRTAALSTTTGADSTANNSLSASARTVTGTVVTSVTALDYSRASVALATGGVRLTKAPLTGPGAQFVSPEQLFAGEVITRPFSIFVGQTVSFTNLPGGASCTVIETGTSGQTSYLANTVIIDPRFAPVDFPLVTIENDYQLASLSVSKVVTTTAPVIPTAFAFTVACTFLGQPVALTAGEAVFTLNAGDPPRVVRGATGIPANATCVVTEVDAQGADATIITAQTDPGHGGSVAINNTARTATFTGMSPDSTGSVTTNTATFDNRFGAPAILVIQKDLQGAGAPQFGQSKTFDIDVLCTFGNSTQFDRAVSLNASGGFQARIDNVIAGSVCTFTEPDRQGADAVVITPNNGADTTTGVVTVPNTATPVVTITATNWYLTGSVEVTKVFAGDTDAIDKFGRDPAVEYEIELVCTREGRTVLLDDRLRTVTAASPTARYTNIASGAVCVLSETNSGGASSWRILDETEAEVPGGEFTISVVPTILSVADQAQGPLQVENTFRLAAVSVAKTVVPAVLVDPSGPVNFGLFEFELECTLAERVILPLEDPVQFIADGGTFTWTELAEGADCSITETDPRNALVVSYRITGAAGAAPTLGTGVVAQLAPLRSTGNVAPNAVEFLNSYVLPVLPNTGMVGSRFLLVPLLLVLIGVGLLAWQLRRRRTLAR